MKIRSGFVSNSSSTDYMIYDDYEYYEDEMNSILDEIDELFDLESKDEKVISEYNKCKLRILKILEYAFENEEII